MLERKSRERNRRKRREREKEREEVAWSRKKGVGEREGGKRENKEDARGHRGGEEV